MRYLGVNKQGGCGRELGRLGIKKPAKLEMRDHGEVETYEQCPREGSV